MTIQQLLQYVVTKRASDLHVVVGSPPMVRIDGDLKPMSGEPVISAADAGRYMAEVMTGEQKQLFEANKEIDFSFQMEQARFRVNAYVQKGVPAGSFRLVPLNIPSMEELGLPKIVREFALLKQGFVLVTGPTGQGKSTTLASILQEINKTRPAHIVTIEDPIEYVYMPDKAIISQREMHNDTHSWNVALRSVLREDPDVVLVGEMRDLETISSALTIAETGHLVFATLHTNSAAQTVDRIVDVFQQNQQPQVRLQLASTLEAVFSQRLVPRANAGRALAYEIMVGTTAVRTAIRESRTHMIDNIIMTSGEYGMTSLDSSLETLVESGVVAEEVARAYLTQSGNAGRVVKGENV